ncbi:ferredoxin [Shimia thalassica]|uniref:ferredoxin n=1 Tax=Shimia thalassica TaxID=1715693 RepID=UPI0026E30A5E|nr:ferredoxin [Shimia thalassica]MDO6797824.1 ferredoxin [Shimia thalassica]
MNYGILQQAARAMHLDILGAFHPEENDAELSGFGTLVMLSPLEPDFWDHFTTQREFIDKVPNPVDQWSSRVVTALAAALGAQPFFPFTGPPYQPFYQWALKTGRCYPSPINLLVHDTAGLFVSFRGAIALPQKIDLPASGLSPCESCADKPCLSTCPVDAFASGVYDVGACRDVIGAQDPKSCLSRGCAARRSCPASSGYGRLEEQSSYHMRVFLENGP